MDGYSEHNNTPAPQWLERLLADQHVPGSNLAVPLFALGDYKGLTTLSRALQARAAQALPFLIAMTTIHFPYSDVAPIVFQGRSDGAHISTRNQIKTTTTETKPFNKK
jgi:hypothetical protein